ncbi:MAG: hypothetical protein KDC69_10935 [Flavobacteriaceae bacterium]|nr:hypothetical protein [Flavobacteriaceae bacterium]MCB0706101.1 hypothetical protein [Saprospiraceae bacterium]
MKKIVPIILVIAGLALLIYGFTTWQDSKAVLEIGKLELSAGDQEQSNQGILFLVLGVIALGGGLLSWKK